MSQVNTTNTRSKTPRKVADHAFLRIHFEICKTMDLIDDITDALSQALNQRAAIAKQVSSPASKYYCSRCVRRHNARHEVVNRLKNLQILASEPSLPRVA